MSKINDLDEFICARELTVGSADVKQTVSVMLGKPRAVSEGEFVCPFQITGTGAADVQYAHGIDCLQALLMAIEGIRTSLEKSGLKFTWAGGEAGEHGIPRFVPAFFGAEFSRRIEKMIDHELHQFAARRSATDGSVE